MPTVAVLKYTVKASRRPTVAPNDVLGILPRGARVIVEAVSQSDGPRFAGLAIIVGGIPLCRVNGDDSPALAWVPIEYLDFAH